MTDTHDPMCETYPVQDAFAKYGSDELTYMDDSGKVQYRGCQCDLLAAVRADERQRWHQHLLAHNRSVTLTAMKEGK